MTAWEASMRGLFVCLLERNDFLSATSSNSLKILHGGLRYLQHLDVKRMRESAVEQAFLMRLVPRLIRPLLFVVPTYGHGLRGREAFRTAIWCNDLLRLGLGGKESNSSLRGG